jgi:hypothetical protein
MHVLGSRSRNGSLESTLDSTIRPASTRQQGLHACRSLRRGSDSCPPSRSGQPPPIAPILSTEEPLAVNDKAGGGYWLEGQPRRETNRVLT